MPELNKRLDALSIAITTAREEVMGLLHSINEDLADLPHRLYRTKMHDQLVTTVSVLMAVADHLGHATANLDRLKEPRNG